MSDSDFASAVYATQLDNWMNASVSVLAIYEYFITVDQELSSVWKRKISVASILLLLIRWSMLLQSAMAFVYPSNLIGCKAGLISSEILIVFILLLVGIFSGLRVYALWGGGLGGLALFTIVFFLNLPAVAINAYTYIDTEYEILPFWGCVQGYKFSMDTQIVLSRAARIPIILGDAIVLVVTWYKSIKQLRDGRRLEISVPLSTLLFRDGTMYFLILLVMNVLELCTNLPQSGIVISFLAGGLPPILINRFMLNLRQLTESEAASQTYVGTVSTPMFRISVAGNMGESLEPGWDSRPGSEEDAENTTSSDGGNLSRPPRSDSKEDVNHSA